MNPKTSSTLSGRSTRTAKFILSFALLFLIALSGSAQRHFGGGGYRHGGGGFYGGGYRSGYGYGGYSRLGFGIGLGLGFASPYYYGYPGYGPTYAPYSPYYGYPPVIVQPPYQGQQPPTYNDPADPYEEAPRKQNALQSPQRNDNDPNYNNPDSLSNRPGTQLHPTSNSNEEATSRVWVKSHWKNTPEGWVKIEGYWKNNYN